MLVQSSGSFDICFYGSLLRNSLKSCQHSSNVELAEDSNTLTDWIEIPTTSTTKCSECHYDITPGLALWSKSAKLTKHLTCKKKQHLLNERYSEHKISTADVAGSSSRGWIQKTQTIELKCFICGHLAGCQKCRFTNSCDREIVSQLCVCEVCMDQMLENDSTSLNLYQKAFIKKAKITTD
jgi:hypothetical protein